MHIGEEIESGKGAVQRQIFTCVQTFRRPVIRDTRKKTKKKMKQIWAIPAAVPATPVKPSTPAMRAITRKVKVQLNIYFISSLAV
jgi:hypothetical protein